MKALLLPLLLAACAAGPQAPYSPTRDVQLSAVGQDPFWLLSVGSAKIVLTSGPAEGAGSRLSGHTYRGVRASFADGVKRWDAGSGVAVISVEARQGRCEGARGAIFEEQIRVRLSGREMHGCGGRMIERSRG